MLKSDGAQKGRHPALDAGSPIFNIGRRCRIKVRHDGIDDKLLVVHPFWTPSLLFSILKSNSVLLINSLFY